MKKLICVCSLCSLFFFVLLTGITATAGEVSVNSDGSTIWQAGIDGVEIEWGADGSFNRIYSLYSHPVNMPDRRGINKAYIIAEEKAKAAIVRFMEQRVTTSRVVTEVNNDFEQSTFTQGTGTQSELTKKNQRTMVENLAEITGSNAAAALRGVIILEKGYDKKNEEVWVKVGISRKTMAASRSLKSALQDQSPQGSPAEKTRLDNGINLPESEIKRTPQKDW